MVTNPLLSWVSNVLVCVEQRSDVHCLAAPEVAMDGPVKGQFEGAAVEGAVEGLD